MSRLCRLKNKSHGDDGQWAYNEIVSLRKQRDELLSDIAKESAERDAVNTIAKRQSAILTRTGDELADCRTEIAALKAERDTRIAQLERQRDELNRLCEFNEKTMQFLLDVINHIIDEAKLTSSQYELCRQAIASAKGEQ